MIFIALVLLGLCFGSFVSALTWRLHEQSKKKKLSKELSIVSGRSMCPHCKHQLQWYDLLPVFSWLSTAGKCRYCKKPVSWQYPALELGMAGLFVLSYLVWPYGFANEGIALFAGWLIVLVGLVALAVYDFRWMLLPDKIVFPLTGFYAALLLALAIFFTGNFMPFVGGLLISGLFWLIFHISDGRWIGFGDVKLGLLLGMLAGGVLQAFAVVFLASLLGLLSITPLLLSGKLKPTSIIPFGPFLIAAAVVVFLSSNILRELITLYIYPY